jgi:hypothetical protein
VRELGLLDLRKRVWGFWVWSYLNALVVEGALSDSSRWWRRERQRCSRDTVRVPLEPRGERSLVASGCGRGVIPRPVSVGRRRRWLLESRSGRNGGENGACTGVENHRTNAERANEEGWGMEGL